jgi:hypothetical protein
VTAPRRTARGSRTDGRSAESRHRLPRHGACAPISRRTSHSIIRGRPTLTRVVPWAPRGAAPETPRRKEIGHESARHDARARPPRRGPPQQGSVAEVGPLPERAPVGERARERHPERRGLERRHARSIALAGVPERRGRHRRLLRREHARLLFARDVEPQGSDHQGAALRPDQQRGQSRRGRQGVLLLSGQHADPLVRADALQVPAGGVPVRPAGPGEPLALEDRVRVRADGHGRVRRRPLLRRLRRVREGRPRGPPHPHHGREPRPRGGAAGPAAPARVPQHVVGRLGGPAARAHGRAPRQVPRRRHQSPDRRDALPLLRPVSPAAVLRQRDEPLPPLGAAEPHDVPEGRHQRLHRHGPPERREPGAPRDQGRVAPPADGRARSERLGQAAAHDARAARARRSTPASTRPTSSTATSSPGP